MNVCVTIATNRRSVYRDLRDGGPARPSLRRLPAPGRVDKVAAAASAASSTVGARAGARDKS
jgi:hypothetical protein